MAPQFRHRAAVLAVLAAAPVVALSVFAGGAADAATESGEQIVFNGGGLLGLSCVARPDVRSITVPADSTVRVVNRTGYRARLLLDGATQGEIQNESSAEVLFRRGPVTLKLKPSCVLSEESRTVRVSVEPARAEPTPSPEAPAAAGDPEPAPSVSAPAPGTLPDGGGTSGGTGVRGGMPNAVPGPQRSSGAGLPDSGLSGGSGGTAARPGATAQAGRPVVVPGMPPGENPLLVPGPPTLDLSPAGAPDGGLPTAADGSMAAEPVAALDPLTETGPVGLLAIIATVCAAGVTAGAIRAIVSQRANRATMV
ncbi:hypothetical protein [Spirilliplanes yamanashiensis]|uniref:PEGA domain-containing protein n=1 Tax=Spirilliplanes yamanashiensis TaxID=42233 RepID=A0A8J3Y669_9ACTN|nr:hypothetical protein [Spirilliplanes yamanashiensis]MDP9814918.1 hypothetical protein [Spirilliplanes yamanashiensis]GIJ02571.1 hypothetical protein Sya03_19230 [Spirilliplanes yamanashiensis]